jgi:diguanylate cyclase (GGDEF)-like protein/PAS domain S-box-containing protein
MDMADGHVIAYELLSRPGGAGPPPLEAALVAARMELGVPLVVPVTPQPGRPVGADIRARTAAAGISASSVLWLVSLGDARLMPRRTRRLAEGLKARGLRIGFDGQNVLDLSWQDMAALQPSFVFLEADPASTETDVAMGAALAGVLAFADRLGCRVVARGVEGPEQAEALLKLGVFYGTGSFLGAPVVLEAAIARPGDRVVDVTWFRLQSNHGHLLDQDQRRPDGRGGVDVRPARPVQGQGGPNGRPALSAEAFSRVVAETSRRLFLAEGPPEVLETLADVLPQVVDFDRLAIFEADWTSFALRPKVLIGEELEPIARLSQPLGTGITGWAFLRGVPFNCGSTANHPETAPIPGSDRTDESLLVVPLTSGNRRVGVLDLWRDGVDQFTAEDVERVAVLGRLAADAWRSAMERSQLMQRVMTDTGTGLLNKRWWDELAPREAAQAVRTGDGIALLLVDLDDFKAVNDTLGHASGDAVLSRVARALSMSTRSGDAVVRIGGDEFVLMLRGCAREAAMEVAGVLLAAVGNAAVLPAATITASIGIALFPEHGDTLDEVLRAADQAMYRAKAAGKGQVAFYSDTSTRREAPPAAGSATEDDAPQLGTRTAVGAGGPAGESPGAGSPGGEGPAGEGLPATYWRAVAQDVEDEWRVLLDTQRLAMIGSFRMDVSSGAVEWSPELRRILGIPPEERPSAAGLIDRIHPDDVEEYVEATRRWIEAKTASYEHTCRVVDDHGRVRHVQLRARARASGGGPLLVGTVQDVTDLRHLERARRFAEEQLSLAFEHGPIGMLTTTLDARITRVNPALCEMLGRAPGELLGHETAEFAHPEDVTDGFFPSVTAELGKRPSGIDVERRFVRPDGRVVTASCHLTLVSNADGEPTYIFGQLEDITARRRQEEELSHLALEDPLTGLPNRQLLRDRLARAIGRTRESQSFLAVVLVGIDHFKLVNDSLGRTAGDQLLMQAARRMADGVRASDTVARLSGDEFVLLCEKVDDIDHARRLSRQLESSFATAFVVEDKEIYLTVSCGVCLGDGSEPPEELLRRADAAMHAAQERGRARSVVFDDSVHEWFQVRVAGRLDLEANLRRAVERGEIDVFFQPILRLADMRITGLEALARWDDPVRGVVSPATFVPIAEEIGLIGTLGEHVLDRAMAQLARWREEVPGAGSLYVTVNLSPRQLVAADAVQRCLDALSRYRIEPRGLRIEVTESTVMDDLDLSTILLRGLSEAGIAVVMDDFGTGFSSLSRLRQLPVSMLKIDRSFVSGLGSDPSDSSIVHATVGLGRALGLELCAEGVELPVQRDELVAMGCENGQGYLWSPPRRGDELTELLRVAAPVPEGRT